MPSVMMETGRWLLPLALLCLVGSSTVQAIYCLDAQSGYSVDWFKGCSGDIRIDGGNGSIDLSTWSVADIKAVFSKKTFDGGFKITNSATVKGKDVFFSLQTSEKNAHIIIENNLDLVDLLMETSRKSVEPPYVRVSGNRKLEANAILILKEQLVDGKFRNDSHIQVYQECDLGNKAVADVTKDLKGCSAIYGDLTFNSKTQFPPDMSTVQPLEYVQGCLRITGTRLTSWSNLTHLLTTKTTSLGGCNATGHEISGNLNICIHPPLAAELKNKFLGMKINNNLKCKGECSNNYIQNSNDPSCLIVTDSLVIDSTTSPAVLASLRNIEEIHGLLQVTGTNIDHFTYLPKLTKLNTRNYTSGAVIHLQFNNQLKTFDLPLLNASRLFTGSIGQLKYRSDKNTHFTADNSFLERIGVNKSKDTLVVVAPSSTSTVASSVANVTLAAERKLSELVQSNYKTIGIAAGITAGGTIVIAAAILAAVFVFTLRAPKKWEAKPVNQVAAPRRKLKRKQKQKDKRKQKQTSSSTSVEATEEKNDDSHCEQADLYQYSTPDDVHQEVEKMIEGWAGGVEKTNEKHRQNTDHKNMTLFNHMAVSVMPGPFQLDDYKKNTAVRKAKGEVADENSNGEEELFNDMDEFAMRNEATLLLPAEKNGLYGQAFQKKINFPEELAWRTQCNDFGAAWFLLEMPPIYPEKFASTAKRMAEKACKLLSDEIKYKVENRQPIEEFGITSKGFNATVIPEGEEDPVETRAKKETEDVFWFKDQLPKIRVHRYRKKLNAVGTKKIQMDEFSGNLTGFVERMVDKLMDLPPNQVLNFTPENVLHFLKVIQPSIFGNPAYITYHRAVMATGEYSTSLNKTHVRIVGEIRGDFDALRRAINIPSEIGGKEHPLLQYNWVFLGNYTGRHPQSLETLLFLLALQFLYGWDCIVLLRGVMEFKDTNEPYGFKDNLIVRFGKKKGPEVWECMMKVVQRLPLNCQVLYGIYCSYGGFNETDIKKKDPDYQKGKYHTKTAIIDVDKIFSLPSVTVTDYLENADTHGGYYYGERVLQKIASETEMYTFFSTMPMRAGVGFFSDCSAAKLITISSVRHLHGHGGQKTEVAAVAEVSAETCAITLHMILHEDESFVYNEETDDPYNWAKKPSTVTTATDSSAGGSTVQEPPAAQTLKKSTAQGSQGSTMSSLAGKETTAKKQQQPSKKPPGPEEKKPAGGPAVPGTKSAAKLVASQSQSTQSMAKLGIPPRTKAV